MTDCVFCRIIRREIPANIVLETEKVLAFHDINPEAPTHVLVIPKKHIANIRDEKLSTDPDLTTEIFQAIQKITSDLGLAEDGFRVVVNCGENAGETVHHLHFHLLGGRELTWPPG
ncbi:MAG TPA: histidine triad nucleotide-binding protein [Firmicutes bacterium]|nr:histidine triad nucleotide-binding protein [Bacillota bacterium]